jgi:phosphate starvation-inducible membrane PsiE
MSVETILMSIDDKLSTFLYLACVGLIVKAFQLYKEGKFSKS